MASKRPRQFQPLKLNEIIEELEYLDEEDRLPNSVAILPPENANADVTDEDSGDEEMVTWHNLPGSQLRAPADLVYTDDENSDSEDELPLSVVAKRRCGANQDQDEVTETGAIEPTPSTSAPVSSHEPVIMPSVSTNQKYTWRNYNNPPLAQQWQKVEGPKNLQPPLYYFDCMFDDHCIQLLINYTNLYASRKNKEGNVKTNEMKCFLGILLFSGYVPVPRRTMYWENSTDADFQIVHGSMSRDRFDFIMSNIHCCDNLSVQVSDDKFAKLRPLLNMLNENCIAFAPLDENYSVDEAMVPYYGRHSCKQFIREKPIRWGYKFWVGTTRLGYVLWFEPYQGKSSKIPIAYKQFGLGGSVILQFADVLQSRDRQLPFHLYFDNFFTSIPLLHELTNRGLKATGTIRENRTSRCPLPPSKEMKKNDRGSYKSMSSRPADILVCRWNDNSVVTVASNTENVEPLNNAKRFSQQLKKYIQIEQPSIIKKYNENMGGVDRADQNIGLYRTSVRGKKWYFPLICHCLDVAEHNAWQLYKNDGGKYDHLSFRRVVARSLLESYKKDEKRGPRAHHKNYRETSRYDRLDHLIQYQENQLRCAVCKKKAKYCCKKCSISLHPKACFASYHSPA